MQTGSRTKSHWTKTIGQYPSGHNPRKTKTQEDKIPGGQKPRGTKSKWDNNQGWQKPRGTKPHRDKNPWRTISQGTESQGDTIPRFSQEWCICVLRPEKYMTIGPCLVMLRMTTPEARPCVPWNHYTPNLNLVTSTTSDFWCHFCHISSHAFRPAKPLQ